MSFDVDVRVNVFEVRGGWREGVKNGWMEGSSEQGRESMVNERLSK